MTTEPNDINKLEVNFNDAPIESESDDKYGFSPFASRIARAISRMQNPIGTTIAINGPWGSGKTSVLNLIKAEIKKVEISEFKCLWFRGEEALAFAFLAHLSTCLGEQYKEIVKPLFGYLRKFSSLIGHAVELSTGVPCGVVVGTAIDTVDEVLNQDKSIEQLFQDLCDKLEKSDKRYLIVIDDIDRLSSKEILAVFRILRSIGQLPNVVYLLAFERGLVERAIELDYPSDGGRYLEKIIQASFDIPVPPTFKLKRALLTDLYEIFGDALPAEDGYFEEVIDEVVMKYVKLPRHVERFRNIVNVTWRSIENEVSLVDFLGMESIRIYDAKLFSAIANNRELIIKDLSLDKEKKCSKILLDIEDKKKSFAERVLHIFFPQLYMGFGTYDFRDQCQFERRICIKAYFDTYFQTSLSQEALSIRYINDLINNADNEEYIKSTILKGKEKYCPSGQTEALRNLYELGSHAEEIELEKVEPLLKALFEIYDYLDEYCIVDALCLLSDNTFDIYKRLILRSTHNRMGVKERSQVCLRSIGGACLGWIVRFVYTANKQYQQEKSRDEDNLLVAERDLPLFREIALKAIYKARDDGSLLERKDLKQLLISWNSFTDKNINEVKIWTSSLMNDVDSLIKIAKLTIESNKGKQIRISSCLSDCDTIIDIKKFIDSLYTAHQRNDLKTEDKESIETLLKLFQKNEEA